MHIPRKPIIDFSVNANYNATNLTAKSNYRVNNLIFSLLPAF
jgi:hypothetical protein